MDTTVVLVDINSVYPSLWLVFRTRHGSQIWCVLIKITKNPGETGKKNHNAPFPRSSSLLTLPQGSLATPFFVGTTRSTHGMVPKSFFSNLKFWKFSDFENFEIPKNFEEKIIIEKFENSEIFLTKIFSKIFRRRGSSFFWFWIGAATTDDRITHQW